MADAKDESLSTKEILYQSYRYSCKHSSIQRKTYLLQTAKNIPIANKSHIVAKIRVTVRKDLIKSATDSL